MAKKPIPEWMPYFEGLRKCYLQTLDETTRRTKLVLREIEELHFAIRKIDTRCTQILDKKDLSEMNSRLIDLINELKRKSPVDDKVMRSVNNLEVRMDIED
jgi:hypothetical protein